MTTVKTILTALLTAFALDAWAGTFAWELDADYADSLNDDCLIDDTVDITPATAFALNPQQTGTVTWGITGGIAEGYDKTLAETLNDTYMKEPDIGAAHLFLVDANYMDDMFWALVGDAIYGGAFGTFTEDMPGVVAGHHPDFPLTEPIGQMVWNDDFDFDEAFNGFCLLTIHEASYDDWDVTCFWTISQPIGPQGEGEAYIFDTGDPATYNYAFVGYYTYVPVPEPATGILALSGAAMLLARRRRSDA
ncbi:MAG: PEP-CTERM sorting domain-containing protein [Kiritimatiellaeota bacterium]|nr:PEP-CTERM sorting domain-containing protein [Kiritimatiellota bacterium]